MAVTTIRSSYALHVESVEDLAALAAVWGVSKSEALRRAIAMAKRAELAAGPGEALRKLHAHAALDAKAAADWAKKVRAERQDSRR